MHLTEAPDEHAALEFLVHWKNIQHVAGRNLLVGAGDKLLQRPLKKIFSEIPALAFLCATFKTWT